MNNQIEDGWFFHNHAWHLLHEIIKLIPPDTDIMLDSGAGPGVATAIIKALYPDITIHVTDICEENRVFWKKRNLFGHIVYDEAHPFKMDTFDFSMSSHVLEHVKNTDLFVSEMIRVTRKRVVIVVPDGDLHMDDHKSIFNRSSFLTVLNIAAKDHDVKEIRTFPVYHQHINNLVGVIDL
jgi:ubiquinone/menaquinone biosynthesis C-methylase UbiE